MLTRLILTSVLSTVLIVSKATNVTDTFYKEVVERGYEIIPGDSVILPDGTVCSIHDFNEDECGILFKSKPFCVQESHQAWDANSCCESLIIEKSEKDDFYTCEKEDDSWFNNNTLTYFFIGALIPLGLFLFLAIQIKKRIRQKLS